MGQEQKSLRNVCYFSVCISFMYLYYYSFIFIIIIVILIIIIILIGIIITIIIIIFVIIIIIIIINELEFSAVYWRYHSNLHTRFLSMNTIVQPNRYGQ